MFDVEKVIQIIGSCTLQVRKGPVIREEQVGPLAVMTVDSMPSANDVAEALGERLASVDVHFMEIAVDKERAEENRAALVEQLDQWPRDFGLDRGPSYIAIGALLGDQGRALQLFGLGEHLGLWKVITPERLGLRGEEADKAAGLGYVMMTGYSNE